MERFAGPFTGLSAAAVLGPALTPGRRAKKRISMLAPFTGLLGVQL
jgi:hypothetical protein